MLSTIDLEKSYHNLTEMMVCNRQSKIFHETSSLYHYIRQTYVQDTEDNEDSGDFDEVEIDFTQWTTTDWTDTTSMKLSLSLFINLLYGKIDKIISHSVITRSQASYLAHLKETIRANMAIVLGDFAENFSFIILDEIQGYHWNRSQE